MALSSAIRFYEFTDPGPVEDRFDADDPTRPLFQVAFLPDGSYQVHGQVPAEVLARALRALADNVERDAAGG